MERPKRKERKDYKGKVTAHVSEIKCKHTAWLFILPSLLGVGVFYFIPYIDVVKRSLFSINGMHFQGVETYKGVLLNPAFQTAVKNTGMFMLFCIPLLLVLSLTIAIWVNNHSNIGKWLKTGFLIPLAIPVASVVLLWKILFDNNGLLNGLLVDFNLSTHSWMDTKWAFVILIGSYIWKNLGYHVILWLAGLAMIPNQIYEAAQIDGASNWAVFRHITLPNLLPMLYIITVLAVINSFKVFREIYLVAGNYPHESIYMLQHLFNNWFRDLALDKIAAGAVLVSIAFIGLVVVLQKAWEDRI